MKKSLFLLLSLVAAPLVAQQEPAPVRNAAATITAADIERRLWIIAHDSMGGRDTPSRGLDMTAQYVADEFRRFGLRPGGDNGTFFQRYSIETRALDAAGSQIMVHGPSSHVMGNLLQHAAYMGGAVPAQTVEAEVMVLGATLAPDQVNAAELAGKIALIVRDYTKAQPATFNNLNRAVRLAGVRAIVHISNRDSTQFAAMAARNGARERTVIGGQAGAPTALEVRDPFVAGLGLDLAAIRGGQAAVRPLPGARVMLALKDRVVSSATAPNTIGILEGSDPALRGEYLIFSSHMDHVGTAGVGSRDCQAKGADSICNGADDDASGTVGVLEVAEAFSRRGVRPRRSIIFMTVSGEEKGLWGSAYWADHPTVDLRNVVANFNVDMIGRNWNDTVVAIGRAHSNLGQVLDAAAARHPELRMTPIDDIWPQENFYFRSDHFNFARKGIPVLFFFTGVHDQYHKADDHVDLIGFDKMSRILQLLFYTSYAVAQNPERPRWTPESYEQIVEPAVRAARAAVSSR